MRIVDLTSKTFGRLTVIKDSGERRSGAIMWECECSCGSTVKVHGASLKKGLTKSCGCLHRERTRQANQAPSLAGHKFGRLSVIKEHPIRKGGEVCWECNCDCGAIVIVRRYLLVKGVTTSCGCYQKEQVSKAIRRHGKTQSRVYKIYQNMLRRCCCTTSINYERYGGRGITVCEKWLASFDNFFNDMGDPPTPQHSLDRVNNMGNYEPNNCRWATSQEQNNNSRKNRKLTLNGITRTVSEWARELGIARETIKSRLNSGWDTVRTLTTPVR